MCSIASLVTPGKSLINCVHMKIYMNMHVLLHICAIICVIFYVIFSCFVKFDGNKVTTITTSMY